MVCAIIELFKKKKKKTGGVRLGYGWGTGELDNINKMRRAENETIETKRRRERHRWGTLGNFR